MAAVRIAAAPPHGRRELRRLLDAPCGLSVRTRIIGVGAGAAGIGCPTMLHKPSVPTENVTPFDREGVLHPNRTDLCPEQMGFAGADEHITLIEALDGTDMFPGVFGLGHSPAGGAMIQRMAAPWGAATVRIRRDRP